MRKGWEYKKLNEVCEKGASNIVINKLTDNSGEYPLFGASGLVKNIDFFHQDKPYIGIVKDGAGVGRVNIYPAYSSLVGTMQYIFPKEGYSIDFIKYFLVKLDLSHCVSGATIPHIYFKDYGKENIPTPSLDTQLAIVSELDKINELIRLKKEQLKDFDNLAQSLFYEMFGDPVENEKGWEVKKLGEIAKSAIGLTYKPENVTEELSGTVVLRSSNIQNSILDFNDIVRVNVLVKEDKMVNDGDILMCSRNGSFRLVGKVALIKGLKERMSYGAFMTIIRSPYNPYLFEYFKTPAFRQYLITGKTTTVNQITVKMLNNLTLPLPPLSLQRLFAQRIEQIEREKTEVQKSIQDLETLQASRMQYWFE